MSNTVTFGQLTDAVADRLRQGQAAKPNTTDRQRLLEYAGELIHGDRNESYDEPSANFASIAALWSAYLGVELEPHDVAVLNVLQKVARLMHTPGHYDSWVDIAGYAACGYEAWLSGGMSAGDATRQSPPPPTPRGPQPGRENEQTRGGRRG